MRRGAETLFLGSYVNKIDAKGRLATPARFRRALDVEKGGAIYCIPSTDEPCLECGGADYIETLLASIAALDPFSRERRSLERTVTAKITEVSLDKEGRVVLPQSLRTHASLNGEALFAGLGHSFQIWNPAEFDKVLAEEEKIVGDAKLGVVSYAAHAPVMVSEVLAALAPRAGGVYVDATFGGGGYTRAILKAAECTVFGFDRDRSALDRARNWAGEFGDRLRLVNRPFAQMMEGLREAEVAAVDGVVFDLGVSSMQLDEAERGFSFRHEGPLSMRMDGGKPDAGDVVAAASAQELAAIFRIYGEEKRSGVIAKAIVAARAAGPIVTTTSLAAIVEKAAPSPASKIHPATRVFQALRIFINDELGQLAAGLRAAESLLRPAGRLAAAESVPESQEALQVKACGGRTRHAARAQTRIMMCAVVFVFIFAALGVRLAYISFGQIKPSARLASVNLADAQRPEIVDRQGALLATDLPMIALEVAGREVWDAREAAVKLAEVLPEIDSAALEEKLREGRYVEVRADLTPLEREAVFNLGLPGVRFAARVKRFYPQADLGAHVVGHAEPGKGGVMGLEKVANTRRDNRFVGAVPGFAPRYAILISFDDPQPTEETYGYATAGSKPRISVSGEITVRLSELAGEICPSDPMVAGLTADSRAVEKGFLFAALPGAVVDGSRFIPQAENLGAAAVLAAPGATTRLPLIVDENPRRRLAAMAAAFFFASAIDDCRNNRLGRNLQLVDLAPTPSGLEIKVHANGVAYNLQLPLIGAFQAENALLAAGIVIVSGEPAERVLPLLEKLSGVPGRMQRAGEISFAKGEAGVYVDYAHTPDAVATALKAIRPHAKGRIIAIIGAGGDRDKTKRQLMGAAASRYADAVIVSDDNPCMEDPAAIRREVLKGCPEAREIGDRREAITEGVAKLMAGDVLLIAGKGHETGQQELINSNLWTAYEAAAATGGVLCARGDDAKEWVAEEWSANGISIDTRSLKPGDMFVALRDARDGHEFLQHAFEAGATVALVARAPEDAPEGAPLLVVGDTLDGLRDLAIAARTRNFGKRIAVTGSAGKTSTKEILRGVLSASGAVHAADKSFNNHWGVPLTLARLPMRADYGVFEIGMNHAGEITPLTKLVRPHAAIVTTVGAAHLEFFDSIEGIAEAKAEIFTGLAPGGVAILPIDNEYFLLLKKRAEEAGAAGFITFGESDGADFQLTRYAPAESGAQIAIKIKGARREVSVGIPGRHQAVNMLAALAAADAVGADLEVALDALAGLKPAEGRGARLLIAVDGGEATLIDESYNANPASMAAAISLLGATPVKQGGRRIAVLGEMLELGPEAPVLHANLAKVLVAAKVDRVYAAGDLMRHLWDVLPPQMRGLYAGSAVGLVGPVEDAVAPGDVVMVKGSNASKVSAIARALSQRGKQEESTL
ncbi:UDP-N-acetylmuramoyl-tripeptide--D-alanyl-D-alanine ligase (D-alanyl-D-alanine-adding enzyme) (UDP-MurNAc-pentapeptide synthetase) [Durusdinium trenchii]|uniref:Transcriptional regulator MraZ n=1 Tax=Durusdinium trenchii TaxID=1381693 RepID=A0ABP0LTI9_9DINO